MISLYDPEFLEFHITKQTLHIMTDKETLKNLVERFGYWSLEVQNFNEVLKAKKGIDYMYKLNSPYVGTYNTKQKA